MAHDQGEGRGESAAIVGGGNVPRGVRIARGAFGQAQLAQGPFDAAAPLSLRGSHGGAGAVLEGAD